MIVIEEVFKSLDNNPNINSESVKKDLKTLIVIFNKNYPAIDLSNLNDKISSVKVENSSKLTFNSPMNYNPRNNVILVNAEEIEKYDVTNLLMNCIVKMISSTKDSYGFVDNDKYVALNAGITAQIANLLVGNGEDLVFDQAELIESNLISSIVGVENLFNAYFTNNKEFARNMFLNEKSNNLSLEDVNRKMDYCYVANSEYISNLGDVEKILIDILYSKKRTEEQIELFENNLVTNNIYMNCRDRYVEIDDVDRIYSQAKINYASAMSNEHELNGRVK